MKISDYSQKALSTLLDGQDYGEISPKLMDQVLGLVGESGEVAEKFKKLVRDKQGKLSQADKDEVIKELGDVLWYIATIAHLLGEDIEVVAERNIEKLASRKNRDVLHGDGDNR